MAKIRNNGSINDQRSCQASRCHQMWKDYISTNLLTTTRPHMRATSNQRTKTMKCVIITYQSGKTAVYLKSDPALLDEILHSNDWIVELHEADFVQPQPTAKKGGE